MPTSLVKTWGRELKAFKDQGQPDLDGNSDPDTNITFETEEGGGPEAVLVPILGYSIECIASL
jgi:hypothetical protein